MADLARIVLLPNQAGLDARETCGTVDPFLVTLRCVARWADKCAIWPLGYPGDGYEGPLPVNVEARDALIARAWQEAGDAAEREYGEGYRLAAAILWAGEEELLDNHDATWASYSEIHLTERQAEDLRECWAAHGLPRDLYIPGVSIAERLDAFRASQRAAHVSEHDGADD